MIVLLRWIDDRTGLVGLVRGWLDARLPGGAGFRRVWPTAIATAFAVQLITGFALWLFYSPGAQSAWESVYFLQYEVAGGWLLRAMHHWSAQVLLVLLGLYLIQMIVARVYRAPRELVFVTAVLMTLVVLGLLLTGDLLAWDQNSLASTQTRVGFLELLPWIGGGLYRLAAGGPQFGHLTLTRFLALHVGCLSGGFAALLVAHVALLRRADRAKVAATDPPGGTARFWPDQALRNAAAMALVVAVVLLLSVSRGVSGDSRGVELGSPANAAESFAAARPEWAFRGLYQFARLFPGGWLELFPIFIIPGTLVVVALAMPWIARLRHGHRFNLAVVAVLLVGIAALSVSSLSADRNDVEHQAALAADVQRAHRAVELARLEGIPPTGALTLLRNDPQTQGPILFQTHCAACHPWLDAEGRGIKAETPSAPNLHGYATREWVGGWLDPQSIAGPDRFGKTKFRAGTMVQTVRVLHEGMNADELAELEGDLAAVAAALSAEAQLASQREWEAGDPAIVARGRDLLGALGCIDCHKFHDRGRLGIAPDHTGYGSREWTMAIIADPTARRFYGDKNDRMPAYAPSAGDPAQSILGNRDIELLTDWLRGER